MFFSHGQRIVLPRESQRAGLQVRGQLPGRRRRHAGLAAQRGCPDWPGRGLSSHGAPSLGCGNYGLENSTFDVQNMENIWENDGTLLDMRGMLNNIVDDCNGIISGKIWELTE